MAENETDDQDKGTAVARGAHMVPAGVAVKEFLDGGSKLLRRTQPAQVAALLEAHGLTSVYQRFIDALVNRAQGWEEKSWITPKAIEIAQEFQPHFQAQGIRLALCIYHSDCYQFRWLWLEFIDSSLATLPANYEPKYNVIHYRIVLNGKLAVPPQGVAVLHLSDFKNASAILNECPDDLRQLLEPKDLLPLYENLTKTLVDSKGQTRTWAESWRTTGICEVLQEYQPQFQSQGIEVNVCKTDMIKWLEFVDMQVEATVDYISQHAVGKKNIERLSTQRLERRAASGMLGKQQSYMMVPKEDLLIDGQVALSEHCPPNVQELLDRKDISSLEYETLDRAIGQAKELDNFFTIWKLVDAKIIEFPPLQEFWSIFAAKGVRVLLCEGVGRERGQRSFWLEYVNVEEMPDYSSPYDVTYSNSSSGRGVWGEDQKYYVSVMGGIHKVPKGVVIQELNGAKKLTDACPPNVQDLLDRKELTPTYDCFIDTLVKTRSTRDWAHSWRSKKIAAVLETFQNDFNRHGVNVAMCKLQPDSGTPYRWFEFIDMEVAGRYIPQYDVSNVNEEEELETFQTTLKFPHGVVVEKMVDRKNVMENTPPSAQALMQEKDCMD
eukprot:scaffold43457_cov252-Amphora_coffeaeformis.AAC.2